MSFLKATHSRRSIRSLQASSPVPDTAIAGLAERAILDVPSAFNSQTARLTVLFGADHNKLWSIATQVFHGRLGDERFRARSDGRPSFEEKLAGYAGAYGTVLFWDDMAVVEELKESSPDIYQDKIEEWAHQSSGMHQYYLWTALEAMGLGANLQHYNPLIDGEVKRTWGVSESWALRAQMVFGTPVEGVEVGEKLQRLPVMERVKVFGSGGEPRDTDGL
ncbi:Nitroreductase [Aulographum hederae CBS 113979]|uniref:Nitroreductase n=1 Tax=Aulographum hederae CBS 113979 TaxID=1176131 RepID=A0A6G1GV61_9PEZI|nr:Nitroreductase [Aulographum hederae CBS 113979]